ncbi:coenzyme F420-0:L-glutamate ligase [Roseomonas sp. BN140053]|uniref:coenzyme F420-0:L-glutamate ligase n=1 Tax=Roseomonas sp. BN140053 TaxID=3391898 RepID=UPI0039E91537
MLPVTLTLTALPGLPMVRAGDDLAALLVAGIAAAGLAPQAGDVLVVAQKIVSKAEGRRVRLEAVTPSPEALEMAGRVEKDPRLVHLILSEARRVVRALPGLLIVEHRLGHIMANAGIDQSNVALPGEPPEALLLPLDPDRSAAALSAALSDRFGLPLAVIVNDSFGRPWRRGTVGVALGVAGLPAVLDRRGSPDLFGRRLEHTLIGLADEAAAAASLLMGQADEARPAVLLRGLCWDAPPSPASALLRDAAEDRFR